MKHARFALVFIACAAAIPALAQNTTDSRCGTTNFDSSRNLFTIVNPTPDTLTQQCFITVVPKDSWSGGSPDLATSQLVEGNYEVVLAGGGGGGGGGVAREGGSGYDGADAIPFKGNIYLSPGIYRITIGSGGRGGYGGGSTDYGGRGFDGGPTSISEAYSGRTLAGYPSAETWAGVYPESLQVASGRRSGGTYSEGNMSRATRTGDVGGGGRGAFSDEGSAGGHGYLQLALKDPVPQPAPAVKSEPVPAPAPVETRPARKDRN
jgi:hypothetical protein